MAGFGTLLFKMVKKVDGMRPIPPVDDLFDKEWEKVDKLIMKSIRIAKDKGHERPLRPMSEALFGMALESPGKPGVQALAYRIMDTRLLVDEFERMRAEARAIHDVARGKDVEVPSPHFPPANPALVPPCFVDRDVYNDSAVGVVSTFAEELRRRGVLPPAKSS
jgi:hypothetical protein